MKKLLVILCIFMWQATFAAVITNSNVLTDTLDAHILNLDEKITITTTAPISFLDKYFNDKMDNYAVDRVNYKYTNGRSKNIEITVTYRDWYIAKSVMESPKLERKANAADMALMREAKSVINKIIVGGMSDFDKVLAIHDYLVNYITYDTKTFSQHTSGRNVSNADAYSAYGALVDGIAVCDGYAQAFALLATIAGIDNQIVRGAIASGGHAWNKVEMDGYWYNVDTTSDDRETWTSHKYMGATDAELAKTHVWNTSAYPEAYATKDSYYKQMGLTAQNYEQFERTVSDKLKIGDVFEIYIQNYNANSYPLSFVYDLGATNVGFINPIGKEGVLTIITE